MLELVLCLIPIILTIGSFLVLMVLNPVVISSRKFRYVKKSYSPRVSYRWTDSRPYAELFDRLLTTLSRAGFTDITENNRDTGTITARTGSTLVSRGERVAVNIGRENQEVVISSKPILPMVPFDFGKGLENIEKILIAWFE